MELLKTIRSALVNDAGVISLVSANNIRVHDMMLPTADKQILLKETLGSSEIMFDAVRGIFTILVFVKDSVPRAYDPLKEITQAVISALDKKNETLIDSNSFVRFFVKTSGESAHNNSERFWMMTILFDYVVGE